MTKEQIFSGQAAANPKVRWIILLIVSFVIAANYYVYDAFSSIKSVLTGELGIDNTDYGIIVAMYSFTNTFLLMTIFGGIILDKWGIRKTGFLFVLLCVLGTFISAYGISDYFSAGGFGYGFIDALPTDYSPEVKMLMIGRLLYGLGAETSIVVINKIIVKWFKGKELAFAFAVNVAIARLGTAMALIFSPILITASTGWTTAVWVAAILMGLGLLVFVLYMSYDIKVSPKEDKEALKDPEDEFKFSDIVALVTNKSFIFIILLCVTFYSAVFPFQAYCPDLLHNKFGFSLESSGTWTSAIIWGTIVFTPLFGFVVDKVGKRATLMILGSFLLLLSHLALGLTGLTPVISMVVLGIAFSLVPAAMWPSVALIVDERRIGTAYGMMASLQNLGLFAFPILAGRILDISNPGVTKEMIKAGTATYDYTYTMIMFAGLGLVGLAFAFFLKREDSRNSGFGLEGIKK